MGELLNLCEPHTPYPLLTSLACMQPLPYARTDIEMGLHRWSTDVRSQRSPVTGSSVSLWDSPRLVMALEVIRDDRV